MSETESRPDEAVEPEKSSNGGFLKKNLKKILLGVGIFFVVLFVYAFMALRGVSGAANDFISQLQAGECSEMYALSSANLQEQASAEEWNGLCETIGPILQGTPDQKSVEVKSGTGDVSIGQVVYSIFGTDNYEYQVSIQMIDQDGWKLDAFDSTQISLSDN